MPVNFGNTQVSNDIAPSVVNQAPVVDRSGEVMGNALKGAFDSIGSAIGGVVSNKKAAASNAVLDGYTQEMIGLSNAVDQGLSSREAATRRRQIYSTYAANNPGLAADLNKLDASLMKDRGIASLVVEGTEEQKLQLKMENAAKTEGWPSLADKQTAQSETHKLNKIVNENNITTANLETGSLRNKVLVQESVKEVVASTRPWINEKFIKAQADLEKAAAGGGGDTVQILAQLKFELNSEENKQYRELAKGADMEFLFKPYEDQLENLENFYNGGTTKEQYENQKASIINKEKVMLLNTDPAVARLVATSETLGSNMALVLPNMDSKTVGKIVNYIQDGTPNKDGTFNNDVPSPFSNGERNNEDRQDNKVVSEIIINTVKDVNKGGASEKLQEEAKNGVSNYIRSMSENAGAVKGPKQMKNAIDMLANEEVNKWAVTNGGIPSESIEGAKKVLQDNFQGPLLEIIQSQWDDKTIISPKASLDAIGRDVMGGGDDSVNVSPKDFVDVIWDGDGVRFIAKPEYAAQAGEGQGFIKINGKEYAEPQFRRYIEGLNKGKNSIAAPLNKLIRASATLEGTSDFEKVWEDNIKLATFPESDPLIDEIDEFLGDGAKSEESQLKFETYENGEKYVNGVRVNSPMGRKMIEDEKERIVKKNKPLGNFNEAPIGDKETDTENSMMKSFTGGEGGLDALNKGKSDGKIVGGTQDGKINGKAVSEATIGEIRSAQDSKEAFAVGFMQIIPKTLKEAIDKGIVSEDEVFNKETQEKLFEYLVNDKRPEVGDFLSGKSSDMDKALLGMAKEFASWPDPKTGNSYYGGGNKAQFGLEEAKAKLQAFRKEPVKGKGLAALDKQSWRASVSNYAEDTSDATKDVTLADFNIEDVEQSKPALAALERVQAAGKAEIKDRSTDVGRNWSFGNMKANSLVVHHTAGRGSVEGVIQTFKDRNFPAHFVVDREGKIHQILGLDQRGQHTKNSSINDISNANSWGVEVIARDDKDITPAQVDATMKLSKFLNETQGMPMDRIFGHGEINTHKRATEGKTIVSALRASQKSKGK